MQRISFNLLGAILAMASVLDGCTGALTVGLDDGGASTSGGTSSTTGSSTGSSSGGGTTSGSSSSGSSTGGTTGNVSACGAGLACYGERCLLSSCVGEVRGAACGLGDGGNGFCAGGSCRAVPPDNDPNNCGFLGASCPSGSRCSEGQCESDAGETAQECTGLTCTLGKQCELVGFLGAYCLISSCAAGDDDQVCASADGGRAVLNGYADPYFCCGAACVDTSTDPNNCGSCGIACGPGSVCAPQAASPTQGICLTASCSGVASGTACLLDGGAGVCCGNACTDLQSDDANCGGCGLTCPGVGDAGGQCTQRQCELPCGSGQACPSGWDCDLAGGFCFRDCSTAPDGFFCGASITSPFIVSGLSKTCCNHRCVDPGLDPANCGGCGLSCDGGEACLAGACEQTDCRLAIGGFTPCALSDGGGGFCCGGRCTDVTRDDLNCGECRLACPLGTSCADSCRSIDAGLDDAGAGDAGLCGGACPPGTLCADDDTACHPTLCGPNDTNDVCTIEDASQDSLTRVGVCCSGVCVDIFGDPNNCAGCGRACGVGATCFEGFCSLESSTCGVDGGPQCAPGLSCVSDTSCEPLSCVGLSNGEACFFGATASGPQLGICCNQRCVDTTQDPANCGGCSMASPSGLCPAGTSDESCIDLACANLATDPNHCGSCFIACPAGQTCSAGTCSGSPSCGPGRANAFCAADGGLGAGGLPLLCCPGFGCVDVSKDDQNCGSCGVACSIDQSCVDGICH